MASFWDKVDKSGVCWVWQLYCMPKGYGQVTVKGKKWLAHRYAYFLAHGEIPDDLQVLHSCDNRPCCNPAHLSTGTNLDNVIDMMEKRRHRYGETHHNAKLSDADVAFILTSDRDALELSEMFGIHRSYVYKLRNGWTRNNG